MSLSRNLESKTKFDIRNPRATRIFTEDEFFKWADGHHYRTSSNDMEISHVRRFAHSNS